MRRLGIANAAAGDDTIEFASRLSGQTLTLTLGQLGISPHTGTDALTINGDIDNNGTLSDQINTTLANNGGQVQTHAIVADSDLIDNGDNGRLPADTQDIDGDNNNVEELPLDAAGNARISNTTVDIGAVEFQAAASTGGGGPVPGAPPVSTGGDDTLNAGIVGSTSVAGGEGNDQIDGNFHDDIICGNTGNDTLNGGAGNDTNYDGQSDDQLAGGDGEDVGVGGTGDDIVYGNQGTDNLYGGQGDDDLYGGQGDDNLYGGAGADTLTGGNGSDMFHFGSGNATVTDFNAGDGDMLAFDGTAFIPPPPGRFRLSCLA